MGNSTPLPCYNEKLFEKCNLYKRIGDLLAIDHLQALTTGYGNGWVCRMSSTGRGLRIHESSLPGGEPTIMGAIKKYLREWDQEQEKQWDQERKKQA